MTNIAAIEKSIMTADENTLREMAGNIGMEIYSRLSPEARQRLAGAGSALLTRSKLNYPPRDQPTFGQAKTEFERMMDELAAVVVKYGYRDLGYQQTLSGEELRRFIKGRDLIDVSAEFNIDEETYELVTQFEKQG